MPSRAWVVTARMSNILNFLWYFLCIPAIYKCILAHLPIFFNQLSKFLRCESPSTFLGTCLSHHSFIIFLVTNTNTLLSGLYLISTYILLEVSSIGETVCQCPHGLELLPVTVNTAEIIVKCQCPHGLELLRFKRWRLYCFWVSMPSRAWVVTARMSNILNFLWYFLCIPAIYKCILAHLPIFFNQLSKFLRCESPSTFLGTYLSHHSFIIFLVTNTNALLSGLYLISTKGHFQYAILYFECVNALSGLYLISTWLCWIL